MKIIDAKVIVCSPGRNFVTLKIVTEDGLTGLGDATLNGRELAVATYLSEHVVPLLVGRDARRIEDTWHYLYKGVYWRKGAVTMTAIAAVDMALWDIAGKAANKPVYQLFGGASREEVLVYSHANGATIDQTVTAVAEHAKAGYRAFARSARFRDMPRATASARPAVTTSRPSAAGCRQRAHGARSRISSSRRCCSTGSGESSGPRFSSSTTCTTGSGLSRPRGSARASNRIHLFWMEDPVAGRAPGGIPDDPPAHDDADCRR